MKYIATIAVCSLLILAGCSGPEAWSSALEETAPPNPNRAHAQSRDAQTEGETTAAEQTQEPEAAPQPAQEEEEVLPTRVSATLEGYPECHVGAVRFYVNRRYRGAFDDEGRITLEVSPGELTLEIWDSGGHWIKVVNVQEGQTLDVTFSCGEKTGFSGDP